MASVLDWLPQLAGALLSCAGWPGSNGSTMAANGGAVVACAEGGLDGEAVAVLALLPDDEVLLLHPAARPIRTANTTARPRYRSRLTDTIPVTSPRSRPPGTALMVAGSWAAR